MVEGRERKAQGKQVPGGRFLCQKCNCEAGSVAPRCRFAASRSGSGDLCEALVRIFARTARRKLSRILERKAGRLLGTRVDLALDNAFPPGGWNCADKTATSCARRNSRLGVLPLRSNS